MSKHTYLGVLAALLLSVVLPACGGGIPLPCPPFCPTETEPYDCANPPELTGLVEVVEPFADEYIIVLKNLEQVPDLSGFSATTVFQEAQSIKAIIEDAQALASLLADPRVAYVQQNGRKHTTVEWGLDRVDQRTRNLDGVFNPSGDGAGVNVAIVDTGVAEHQDFGDRLADECFTAHTFGGCNDMHGHGTHVAGTAAGTQYGVAKQATIYSVRVLNQDGSGSDTDVIGGIEWVIEQKDKDPSKDWVINMSLGGSPAPALDAATCRAIEAGVTVVVAAGNSSEDAYKASPARVKQAVTVGAMGKGDQTASFTNYGPGVDIFAPGVAVRSAKPGGGSQVFDGTSMASPHVAGGAALVLGGAPGTAPADVEASLVAKGTPDTLSGLPGDTVNLLLYVGKAPGPEPTPTPTPSPDCAWNTPTARSLVAQGVRVEIRPKQEGRRGFGATPLAQFGNEYYCQPGLWPEACNAGRSFGPVAPDGHPDRVACEKQFLELPCANFTVDSPNHMSFDPFICIRDADTSVAEDCTNQNHPRNVEACGQARFTDDPSWRKEEYQGRMYIVEGQWSWATAHGTGQVCAEARDGAGKHCVSFRDPAE